MKQLLLYHSSNDCINAPQCYVIRTLSVSLLFVSV